MFYRSVTLALLLGAAGAQAESASNLFNINKELKGWAGDSAPSTRIEGSAPVRPRRAEAEGTGDRFGVIPPSVTDGLAEELERRLGAGVAMDNGDAPAPVRGDEVATIR